MVDENHQLPCARPDGGKLTSPGAERAGKSPKEEPPVRRVGFVLDVRLLAERSQALHVLPVPYPIPQF